MAMPVDSDDQQAAADRYEQALPRAFDLVHLGLGQDGSTASLYPGDAALEVSDRDVSLYGPRMGAVGMTLTYRGLSKAAEILWLITGTDKAAPLASLCTSEPGVPAARVTSIRTRVVVDAAAARDLEAHPQTGVHLWHRDEAARDSSSIHK
jgi:6-phosphogluconolactonase/glucosamine-6-phosphate isomerase/deaminase